MYINVKEIRPFPVYEHKTEHEHDSMYGRLELTDASLG